MRWLHSGFYPIDSGEHLGRWKDFQVGHARCNSLALVYRSQILVRSGLGTKEKEGFDSGVGQEEKPQQVHMQREVREDKVPLSIKKNLKMELTGGDQS